MLFSKRKINICPCINPFPPPPEYKPPKKNLAKRPFAKNKPQGLSEFYSMFKWKSNWGSINNTVLQLSYPSLCQTQSSQVS